MMTVKDGNIGLIPWCMSSANYMENLGVPEYCSGVVSSSEFLEVNISSTADEQQIYYRNCSKVRLHRQVGSRYFVSAANACKILIYLRNAAIEYLKFTGKDAGNKLE